MAGRSALRVRAVTTRAHTPGLGQRLAGETHERCIYLDYNATTPIFPEVAEEMTPFLHEHFGNPSSGHAFGRPCVAAVATARSRVAALLGCSEHEVVFTSCGSESDNHAIVGVVAAAKERLQGRVPHVVTTNIEHPAVIECLVALAAEGRLTYTEVPVDTEGLVTAEAVAAAMTGETVLVTVMHSNNEIGALLPVAAIAAACKAPGVVVHTDAAQSVGKVPVKVDDIGADLITVVGHKFGAPKGVAALYVRRGTPIARLLHGGGQEKGLRAGTESVILLAGLGKAAELAESEAAQTSAHMRTTRDRLQAALLERCAAAGVEARVNGPRDDARRLPNTLSISLRGLQAAPLLTEVSDVLAASAGSACHAAGASISAVLQAIRLPEELAVGTLRLSVGRHTTAEDVEAAVEIIMQAVARQGVGSDSN